MTTDLLTIAKGIADRVEAESLKQNAPVAVTVIDIHGNVVLTHRMTGAPAFSLDLAERKAYTSALVRMRTADLVPLVQPGGELYPLLAVSGGRYSAMGGGVPISSEGQVLAGAEVREDRGRVVGSLTLPSPNHVSAPRTEGVPPELVDETASDRPGRR